MKKIICILILLLTFKDILYSKTQVECGDVIEIKKRSWYYQMPGEYYYNNKKVFGNKLRDIFLCSNDDEVKRSADKYYSWYGTGSAFSLFTALGVVTSIIITTNDVHSKSTKVSWSITGGLFLAGMILYTFENYYQEKAIDTYNRIIMDNNNIMDDKSSKNMYNKNIDIFSIGYSQKLDF